MGILRDERHHQRGWLQPIISVPIDMAPATPLTPIFLDYWERDLEDDYSTSGFQFAV